MMTKKLKIWFLEIGEPLPIEGDTRLHRYGQLTKFLAKSGHDVTWWTSNFTHAAKKFLTPGDHECNSEGVQLRILKGLGYKRNISIARFQHQANFAKRFLEAAEKEDEKPDVIICPIPTLEAADKAVRFAKQYKIPVLTDIRDEWPEDFVRLAPRPLRWFARILLHDYFKKVNFICKNVDGIIGISKRQLSYGLKFAGRSAHDGDGVFPLGYNPVIYPKEKMSNADAWWAGQGVVKDRFTCVFFGTIGPFFDLATVISAAKILEKETPLRIVVCGTGSHLAKYKKMAEGVPSVLFPGWVDGPQINALMKIANIGLAPYAKDAPSMSLPNKPFEYFAGGLPVLSSIQGELRQILDVERCGISYQADSVEELVGHIRQFRDDPVGTEEMGQRAKEVLQRRFTTNMIFGNLEKHLYSIAGGHK